MLRNTAAASVFVEGDGGSGFSKQFMVEVSELSWDGLWGFQRRPSGTECS